jgi:hypothetical protein
MTAGDIAMSSQSTDPFDVKDRLGPLFWLETEEPAESDESGAG